MDRTPLLAKEVTDKVVALAMADQAVVMVNQTVEMMDQAVEMERTNQGMVIALEKSKQNIFTIQ